MNREISKKTNADLVLFRFSMTENIKGDIVRKWI